MLGLLQKGCTDAATLLGLQLQGSFDRVELLMGLQHAFSQSSNHPHKSDQKLNLLDFDHYDGPHQNFHTLGTNRSYELVKTIVCSDMSLHMSMRLFIK